MKSFIRMGMFALLLAVAGQTAFAQEATTAKSEEKTAAPATNATAGPSSGGEKSAMMEKMKVLTSPGAPHKILESLAGKWTYASKFWMSGSDKPEESTGTSENTMIFGGRFLKQEIKGTAMGQPFEGLGFLGYDNIKEEYVMTWLDDMITGIMTMAGPYDAATKTIHTTGANSCPMTGEKAMPMRWDWQITDNDHSTFTGYGKGPDGKEMKSMEIVYTRTA